MRIVVRLVIVVLMLCVVGYSRHKARTAATTSAGGVPMVQASDNDPRMIAATTEARSRWAEFVTAFEHPGSRHGFAVKHAFPVKGGGNEHMWVNVTAIQGNQISGTLDDEPLGDIGLKGTDPVTLTVSQVEDWAYLDNGKMVGGFSAAVLEAIEAENRKK